jgi:thiol-disulfide isomerase/thioredoxin
LANIFPMKINEVATIMVPILIFCACDIHKDTKVIELKTLKIQADSVFLVDAYDWENPIHFARKNGDKYTFYLDENYSKLKLFSLGYYDNNRKIKLLEYKNAVLCADSIKYLESGFFLDTSKILIEDTNSPSPYFTIQSGSETRAFFRTQMTNFGYFSLTDTIKQKKQLNEYLSIIAENSKSSYLLSILERSASSIPPRDAIELLVRFDVSLRNGTQWKRVKEYFMNSSVKVVKSLKILKDKGGDLNSIYNKDAKLNMVVFWATWCAPCIKEIPILKEIDIKYKDKGLCVIRVSIDNDKQKWIDFTGRENWVSPNLIANEEQLKRIITHTKIESIPYVIFLNKNGEVLYEFMGLSEASGLDYEDFIKKKLLKEAEK